MSAKTKAQLLAEIEALQKRLAELQAVETESHQKNDIYKKTAYDLGERVKELNCLYGISRLVETPGISLPEILQGSVELLPSAWQYPQITCARITLNDREYKTKNFRYTKWKLESKIRVEGKRAGSVEVFYLEEQPKDYEGPFLKEERALIGAIAECLGRIIQRAQAQNSLLETNNYLESLITYANAPIIVWDPALKTTRFNRAFEQLTGYSADEVLDKELSKLFPETNRAESISKMVDTVSGERWESIEIPILHKDGKVSIVLWNSANIYAEDGVMLLSTIAQGQDITERVQAEEALRRSETLLIETGRMAKVGGWEVDAKTFEVSWTEETYRIHEVPLGYELPLEEAFNFFHPDDRPKLEIAFQKALEHGEPYDVEIRLITAKGIHLWTHIICNPIIVDGKTVKLTGTFQDITERKRAQQLMNALNQASVAMGTALTHQEIFNAVAEELKQLDISCMLFPVDLAQDKLITKYMSYESALIVKVEKLAGIKHEDFSFPIDTVNFFQEAVREKKTLFEENFEQVLQQVFPKLAKKLLAQMIKTLRIPKIVSAPLIVEDQIVGVFSVQSNNLTQEDVPATTAFADQLASAWNKVNLLQNLKKTIDGTIQTIAATVEVRDPYTSGHQKRVADLAAAIASQMGLSKERVEGIKMAGVIHDLGKIQIPAEILSKPGKLTDLEFNIIKTHPQVGFDLIKNIEFPWPIAQIVLQHHEKMDGSGYPQGLKGDAIMLEARILCVADVVEAMSSHRPYRPAHGIEKALKQIKNDKGTLLDPKVVNACLKLFKQGYILLKS
ncbi:MAG TPA: PAS domain S-box protein [Anaerolineae bacterium]|nr:PAS domain S-box protein [Anaerolineae bacterium]